MEKILVIDDKKYIRENFRTILETEGYQVFTAGTFDSALHILDTSTPDMIYTDIYLEEHDNEKIPLGIDILKEVTVRNILCPVVVFTIDSRIETAIDAVRHSAFDYLQKPVERERLINTTKIALQHKALMESNERYKKHLEAIFRSVTDAIITVDNKMNIIEANSAVNDIFELTAVAIKSKSAHQFFNNDTGKCLLILKQTLENQRTIGETEIKWITSSNNVKNLLMTSSPLIDKNCNSIGAILVFKDITKFITIKNELRDRYMFAGLTSKNDKMWNIFRSITNLASINSNILIFGETGTGKEKIAKALYDYSSRSTKHYIRVDFSCINDNLIQAELFGHEKGAFTSATTKRIGRFEKAEKGTIFLDEISKASLETQAKLLRVVDYKKFSPLGSNIEIDVDVRIIVATNENLAELVERGKFLEDLYYRIVGNVITLPPLRDRIEDIPLLVQYFINEYNKKRNTSIVQITNEVHEYFKKYPWPGNIRQLKNAIECACNRSHDKYITLDHIPREMLFEDMGILFKFIEKNIHHDGTVKQVIEFVNYYCADHKKSLLKTKIKSRFKTYEIPKVLEEYVADSKGGGLSPQHILQVLTDSNWNKMKAANKLEISREYLYRLMKKYNIALKRDPA